MKKRVFYFLSLVCIVTSCSGIGTKADIEDGMNRIKDATENALGQIAETKESAVRDAENRIFSATDRALKGADEDITGAISDAKSEIQAAVEKSISTQLAAFENDVMKANRRARWAAILALSAIVAAIVFFLLLLRRSGRDSIIQSVTDSKRVERMIRDTVDAVVNTEVKPLMKSLAGKSDIESVVRRVVASPDFEKMLKELMPDRIVDEPADSDDREQVQDSVPSSRTTELYAMDSPGTCLTRLSTDYQRGKSIYRLVLNSPNARTAEISICADKDEVRQRIFKSSNDLLEPICKVQRRSNNPDELTMINAQPGKAEMTSSESWEVVEPILVELS